MSSRSIFVGQSLWDLSRTYLNTASYGLAAAPALATIEEIGVDAINGHDVVLANRFRAGLASSPETRRS